MFFDTIECILLFIFEIKNNVIFGIFFSAKIEQSMKKEWEVKLRNSKLHDEWTAVDTLAYRHVGLQ